MDKHLFQLIGIKKGEIYNQNKLNEIWEKLKEGHDFKGDFSPSIVIDDDVEQVLAVPFPGPEFNGITVGRKNAESDWVLK